MPPVSSRSESIKRRNAILDARDVTAATVLLKLHECRNSPFGTFEIPMAGSDGVGSIQNRNRALASQHGIDPEIINHAIEHLRLNREINHRRNEPDAISIPKKSIENARKYLERFSEQEVKDILESTKRYNLYMLEKQIPESERRAFTFVLARQTPFGSPPVSLSAMTPAASHGFLTEDINTMNANLPELRKCIRDVLHETPVAYYMTPEEVLEHSGEITDAIHMTQDFLHVYQKVKTPEEKKAIISGIMNNNSDIAKTMNRIQTEIDTSRINKMTPEQKKLRNISMDR